MAYESVCPPIRSPTAQFNCQAIAHALYHCLLFALPVVRRTCEIAKHIGHINILYIHKVSLDLSNMSNSDLSRHKPVTKAAQLQVMIKHGGRIICDHTPASLGRYGHPSPSNHAHTHHARTAGQIRCIASSSSFFLSLSNPTSRPTERINDYCPTGLYKETINCSHSRKVHGTVKYVCCLKARVTMISGDFP